MADVFGTNNNDEVYLNFSSPGVVGSVTTGNDSITMLNGDDTVDASLGNDWVDAGAGNDSIFGWQGNDTLLGGSGVDTIKGEDGNDSLFGGSDDTADSIDGGIGDDVIIASGRQTEFDTLDGGDGTDTLLNSDATDLILDTFTSFSNGIEVLSGGGFGLRGNDGDNLLYFVDTLLDDVAFIDGGLGNDSIFGASSGSGIIRGGDGDDSLDGSDFADTLQGDAGNDTLEGFADNDSLLGGDGDDFLDGGTGDNVLRGGDGNDIYIVTTAGDFVSDGGGIDTVRSAISYTLKGGLEDLTLTGGASITGIGNGVANHMIGNDGNNTLFGLGGSDTLEGLDGNDSLIGAVGADSLSGGSGTDTLVGASGSDTLDGGAGGDSLIGGGGNDYYRVDDNGDIVVETGGGIDTIESRVSQVLSGSVENLILTGSDPIDGTGNSLANHITGNDGDNNLVGGSGKDTLEGGIGNDTLQGDSGDDLLYGGSGDDLYRVNNTGDVISDTAGNDTIESSITLSLPSGIEGLVLTGTVQINGIGNALANTVMGNSARNVLDGGGGADSLFGGLGSDTLTGGGASDHFVFATIADAGKGATRDLITDFISGTDFIDLSAIDADTLTALDQAFTFIGSNGFTAAGQLRFSDGIVQGNIDDDLDAEFEIGLTQGSPTAGDFIL